ncbi:guanine nucleotide binding protein, alpha subunit [Mycena galericulata]|nr:guanine nucleotide binding protein, alpha subunit [Mycena galericulata]
MPWPWAALSRKQLIAKAQSDAIDRQLVEDSELSKKERKILLLDSRESGKSAIVNWMKMNQGLDARELTDYRKIIYKNVLDAAAMLAGVVRSVGVGGLEEHERAHAELLFATFPAAGAINAMLSPALADAIWHVAHMPAVERLLNERPADFYPMDTSSPRFTASQRRRPSEADILHACTSTSADSTAMIETRLRTGNLSLHIIDISGPSQHATRRKWMHYFEGVTSIIFCAALSEYDQGVLDGRGTTRLRESISLFESVVNSRWFLRTSVVLFLDKLDVFERKLLKRHFPEHAGGTNVQTATKFILSRFLQANRARLTVYPHFTHAAEGNHVYAAVKEAVLRNARRDAGVV